MVYFDPLIYIVDNDYNLQMYNTSGSNWVPISSTFLSAFEKVFAVGELIPNTDLQLPLHSLHGNHIITFIDFRTSSSLVVLGRSDRRSCSFCVNYCGNRSWDKVKKEEFIIIY